MKIIYLMVQFFIATTLALDPYISICHSNSSLSNNAQPSLKQITPMIRIENLFKSGKLQIITVTKEKPNLKELIESIGALIMVNGSEYLVVAGDRSQINKIIALKCKTRAPIESDYKYRKVKIFVKNKEDLEEIRKICSDIFPIENLPGQIKCRVLDFQIDIMRNRGLNFFIIR